ncbi:MAG: RIP metalloprotease RseP [Acidobacteriaceae bacterium]|nr:RIP metalloprotease RseP [Acidobacteriaceae bacterium]
MGFIGPVFWVVILLGVMILIHELGHFWACLAVGVKVETFSIGFGPRLFGIRRGDTDYRVSAILFGGYVRMLGEAAGDEKAADPRSFQAKARWKRAIVIIAGPLMNVLLAVALVTGLYMYAYPKEIDTTNPEISSVAAGSPAANAGIQPGDRIVQLNGKKNPNWDEVLTEEALNANHPLNVVVNRHGKDIAVSVTPRMDPKEGIGVAGWSGSTPVQVGDVMAGSPAAQAGLKTGDIFLKVNGKSVASPVAVQQAVLHANGQPLQFEVMRSGAVQEIAVAPKATGDPKMPWRIGINFKLPVQFVKLGFGPALEQSVKFNRTNALMVFQVLGSIVERRVSPKSLTGPIGIAQMSSQAAQEGAWNYLFLMAFVSLQLAIFNLLPIPILDGGTLLLLIIEMLLQREVSLQVKETVFKLGFVFLMMVVVFVIYNDISRILTKG